MAELKNYPEHLVFGLDIGTRSIVGTVGYKEKTKFNAVAHFVKEHETRSMKDGQIHDIPKVAESIEYVKKQLEKQVGVDLDDVCIAAAGRVLKTITTSVKQDFNEDTVIDQEHIYSLELLGVEKAYDIINENIPAKDHFYCVGYTTIKYYLNDIEINNLEGHKAYSISADVLATFLPDDVVDGLYTAVQMAGLSVANLTLEPIAAMSIAIPQKFRMLNIALVDVGAGTSDISITSEGSIVAYGMIPSAGDEITEVISKGYLVDFKTAEEIKVGCSKKVKQIQYKDILDIPHKIEPEKVIELVKPTVTKIASDVAAKIKELNGGIPVAAVFVVGGGGKISGFTDVIAEKLELPPERVALRGEEVLREVVFRQKSVKKDSLLVTPIGICLNFYDQKNNFIFVNINGERIKLYNNNKLTVLNAVMHVEFPNERLFPRRGKELYFTVDGKKRMIKGELGESAVISINGKDANINTPIVAGDKIEIVESKPGDNAKCTISKLPEFKNTITFIVNDKKIVCEKYVEVNGELVSEFYDIKNNDDIKILTYYTVGQLMKFMDISMKDKDILVNNINADENTQIYENFHVTIEDADPAREYLPDIDEYVAEEEIVEPMQDEVSETVQAVEQKAEPKVESSKKDSVNESEILVTVNEDPVILKGKRKYILVDVLDFYDFDIKQGAGRSLNIIVNGNKGDFSTPINTNDNLELVWVQ